MGTTGAVVGALGGTAATVTTALNNIVISPIKRMCMTNP
jgi:hypothetical protein